MDSVRSDKEKLGLIEDNLREIVKLSKEFHEIWKQRKDLIRKVKKNEISSVLKNLYENAESRKLKSGQVILVFKTTETKLRAIEKEANRINRCSDPDFKIDWRGWWRDEQILETDENTGFDDPHINVTVKLFGNKKKDVHVILER